MAVYDDTVGDWQGLDSPAQAPRYAAIAELLRDSEADLHVLDVGCGEAVLRSWLPKQASYTGIEPSLLAARKAMERDVAARIVQTTAERFDANGELFDSIVFNEMLYYAADPLGLLQEYSRLLTDEGVVL